MTQVILHHFDASPFAEKIRVALGMKGIDWQAVQIPMVMPKPDLTALTGGYRKTPVMQIGADIYCDTQRIALELETRFPTPTLFPDNSLGQALAIASWADQHLFQPGAGLSMGTNLDLPEDILADRFAFFDFLDRETLPEQLPHLFAQFRANLNRVETMLADGRDWLLGASPSWADASVYASVWMCRGNIRGADQLLEGLDNLLAWEQRLIAIGHGSPSELTADDALAVSQSHSSIAEHKIEGALWPDIGQDASVVVTPEDYGAVPVSGTLVRHTQDDIAIARSDERAGNVVVHFPRATYRLERAGE
ncbi:MAG: glutathione S-transferase family protein [Halioglobus sp.]